jgi:hypothetical protein
MNTEPITVAAPSKARTVFAPSNAEIVGTKPTKGIDVCLRLFCVCAVLCKVAADPPSKDSYRLCIKITKLK